MAIKIQQISKEEALAWHESMKVKNRMPADIWEKLEEGGWTIVEDFSIEKKHKGYFIVIEFCIGDFCVYPCSKNGHWLLEKKISCDGLAEALIRAMQLQLRIDAGEHWTGEND
jgi:hypothetical protein